MWCKQCQEDVPGVCSDDGSQYACPRCGDGLPIASASSSSDTCACGGDCSCGGACGGSGECVCRAENEDASQPVFEELLQIAPEPPPSYDGWELEEQLRHIERVLAPDKSVTGRTEKTVEAKQIRLDSGHTATVHFRPSTAEEPASTRPAQARNGSGWLPLAAWASLSLGLMAFAFGGVLLGWSMATDREDLWSLGLPVALGGQVVLLLGLILQLDRIWRDSRSTASKIDNVDQRLEELKTTTSLLGTTHSSPAANFYCHMADGADPHLLLTDLKNQLDLLAVKIGQPKQ